MVKEEIWIPSLVLHTQVSNFIAQQTIELLDWESFTKRFFNAPSAAKFPFANSKGSDTMLIMKWLSLFCVGCTNDLIKEEHLELMNVILLTAKAGCNMFNIMYNHGLFLTAPCAATLWSELRSFIRGYALLAHRSHYDFQFHGFSMKPKLHLLRHQELELFQRLQDPTCQYFFNPISYGCEMNEDYIGRCCRLSRRCDSRLLVQRVLESVLLKGELLHRRWLASGPRNGRSSTKKAKARLRARWLCTCLVVKKIEKEETIIRLLGGKVVLCGGELDKSNIPKPCIPQMYLEHLPDDSFFLKRKKNSEP